MQWTIKFVFTLLLRNVELTDIWRHFEARIQNFFSLRKSTLKEKFEYLWKEPRCESKEIKNFSFSTLRSSLDFPSQTFVTFLSFFFLVFFIVFTSANLGKQFIVSSALVSYTTKWGHTTTGTWGIWSCIGSLNHGPFRPAIFFDYAGYFVWFLIATVLFGDSLCLFI